MVELWALNQWAGKWRGENRLWVNGEAARVSSIKILASTVGSYRPPSPPRMLYGWAEGRVSHAGVLEFALDEAGVLRTHWRDSWHTGEEGMMLEGSLGVDGAVDVLGHYPAPPGADWGWRITVGAEGERMVVRMYNISPAGDEAMAVEAVCARA